MVKVHQTSGTLKILISILSQAGPWLNSVVCFQTPVRKLTIRIPLRGKRIFILRNTILDIFYKQVITSKAFFVHLRRPCLCVSFSTCFATTARVNRGPYKTFILSNLSAASETVGLPALQLESRCVLTSCVPTLALWPFLIRARFSVHLLNVYLSPWSILGFLLTPHGLSGNLILYWPSLFLYICAIHYGGHSPGMAI